MQNLCIKTHYTVVFLVVLHTYALKLHKYSLFNLRLIKQNNYAVKYCINTFFLFNTALSLSKLVHHLALGAHQPTALRAKALVWGLGAVELEGN